MSTARKQYSRKLAAILTVLAMVLALFPVAAFAADGYFKDVGGTLAAEINKAYEAGLVTGYKDGTFRPNEPVTRAAFAKMIVLAVEKATGEELPGGDEPFSDVRPGQALYEYVVKAYNKGYIKGYPDGTFGYNKTINRQEAAAILQRALDLPLKAENFKDVPDNSGFAKQIGAVAAAGIMKGYGAEFKPAELLNRAQAAAVAYRAFEYLGGKKPEEKLYEVTAVEQASDSSLRVKFNQAVEDTSAVQFDVKLDGEAVEVTPEWAEDKTSVELKVEGLLKAGTYTVKVSGLNFAKDKDSGQVTIEGYEVDKVEQAGDSSLRVTFNKAVENTDAVKFEVKRGDQAVQVTPQWSEDKTSVELKASAKLLDGEYTVTVDGLIFAKDKNVGSAVVDTKVGVASVEVANPRQIRITFDKPVDGKSAEKVSNYEFADSLDKDPANLSDEAVATLVGDRTVYVTLPADKALKGQAAVKVRVDGVVAADDASDVLTSEVYELRYVDAVEPAYGGPYELVAPDKVRVYVTEPVESVDPSKFSLDGGTLAIADVQPQRQVRGDKYYIDVQTGGQLADGRYTLRIDAGGLTDYAGLRNTKAIEIALDIQTPKTPVSVSLVSVTQRTVRLKFSAPVDVTKLGSELFYLSGTQISPTVNPVDAVNNFTDTVDLTFDPALPEGTMTLVVLKEKGDKAIRDAFGNTLASDSVSITLNIVADRTPPAVESVEVVDNDTIKVVFNEPVDIDGATFDVKDLAGNSAATVTASASGKEVTLTLEPPLSGGTYKLEIKNVKDMAPIPNTLTSSAHTFTVKDEEAPRLESAILHADKRKITVVFTEQVDKSTAENVNNYQLVVDGSPTKLPAGSKATLDADGVTVTLVLGAAVTDLDGSSDVLRVANIKDLSGNSVNIGEEVAILAAAPPVLVDLDTGSGPVYGEATSKTTIVVYFDQPLVSVDASKITYTLQGGSGSPEMVAKATFANVKVGSTVQGKVTITLPKAIQTDLSDLAKISLAADAVQSVYGTTSTAADINAENIKDGIAPEVESVVITSDQQQVVITYTEELDSRTVAMTAYEVKGYSVTNWDFDGKNVTLYVTPTAGADPQPEVSQVTTVRDLSGNALGPWTKKAVQQE